MFYTYIFPYPFCGFSLTAVSPFRCEGFLVFFILIYSCEWSDQLIIWFTLKCNYVNVCNFYGSENLVCGEVQIFFVESTVILECKVPGSPTMHVAFSACFLTCNITPLAFSQLFRLNGIQNVHFFSIVESNM